MACCSNSSLRWRSAETMREYEEFPSIEALAERFRKELDGKKCILLYAYNGVGKTRLSTAFKDLGKSVNADGETVRRDTLYFNAFTEDLFTWDNDLVNDRVRKLKLNRYSWFFAGLDWAEMDDRISALLARFANFRFRLNEDDWEVIFSRQIEADRDGEEREGNDKSETAPREGEGDESRLANAIKVSRGEENIFIWCFFLAILELAQKDDGKGPYNWVKYIYIDDPISSLDENNAIAVANHLAGLLKNQKSGLKTVISTHHPLFFNVLCNELGNANRYFLKRDRSPKGLILCDTRKTPFFNHVAALVELHEAQQDDRLRTHHFNMLRTIIEKTASFHGYARFSDCIKRDADDEDGILHARMINLLSHGNYSLFEPQEMLGENKRHFQKILQDFIDRHPFNRDLFSSERSIGTSEAT